VQWGPVLTSDTKRRIDSCRDILVGKLPLPTDQVELITLSLIYKFMDDLDEESVTMGGRRSFFTGPLAAYRWRELMSQTLSAEERMTRFADGLELLGGAKKLRVPRKAAKKGEEPTEELDVAAHLPPLFRDIFRNAFLKFRDGRTLTLFLTELGGFAYSHSEELGNAFEYILSVMGAQGDNGQFRTPRHVIDFMVACLDPQPGQSVLDPACGTGGFLVSAFRHILKNHTSPGSKVRGDRLTHTQRQKLYAAFTGYDINDQMVKLSRVNLFLHEFATPQIHIYDTLTNDARWPEKYDLILANPPFMTPKGGVVPHTRFRVPAKKAEVLFTDYIAEHLTPTGRAGVIVPNGIVATTQTAYVKLRRFLVEESLVAVVSLPAGCFKPYSGVKTSILLLDKQLARTTGKILFVKIAADGFDLGDKRTPIEANDLPEAERLIRAWLTGKLGDDFTSPLAWKVVSRQELLANKDATLNAERFMGGEVAEHEHETVTIGEISLDVQSGYSCSSSKQSDHGVPHLRSQNITDQGQLVWEGTKFVPQEIAAENEDYALRSGDILFNNTNSVELVGKTCLFTSNERAHYSNHTTRIRIDETRAIPRYVALALHHLFKAGHFAKLCTRWVGQAGVSTTLLKQVEFPLPPLEEQRRIVAEIEGYQQVIDGARQILAAYRPTFEVAPEWPMVALNEAVTFTSGGTPGKTNAEYWNGSIPWVSAKDMKTERLSDAQLHVSESAIAETATRLAPVGSILVLVRGMGLANGVPICELLVPCAFNQDIKALLPNPGVIPRFLAAALRQEKTQLDGVLSTAAHGTLKIESEQLQKIQIPLPPLPEQERIVAELEAEAAKVEAVRGLIPLYEAKIQRTLALVWGN
jgi:type I restriction enzyme M protein